MSSLLLRARIFDTLPYLPISQIRDQVLEKSLKRHKANTASLMLSNCQTMAFFKTRRSPHIQTNWSARHPQKRRCGQLASFVLDTGIMFSSFRQRKLAGTIRGGPVNELLPRVTNFSKCWDAFYDFIDIKMLFYQISRNFWMLLKTSD